MIILHRWIAFVTSNCVGINVNTQMMGISVAGGVLVKILFIECAGGSPAFQFLVTSLLSGHH